jgi:hypothetical protein
MNKLLKRMIGAARLDAQTYEQVEADPQSMYGAIFTTVVASMAAAIGVGARDFSGVASSTLAFLMIWMIWVGLTYLIGTRLLPEIETLLLEGNPAETILKAAEENCADLIVMTVSKKGLIERALLGSTAERLIREAHLPVLSIPV